MQDQPVVGVQPEGLGHGLIKLELDLQHVLARREARSVADSENVRVDREGLFAESGVEDDIGRLASDAGQFFQFLAGARYLAAMLADQRFRQSDDVLGLRIEQSDGLDGVSQPLLAERDHLLGRFDTLEQWLGRNVYARVGCLG
jgi:hypothetical protein